MQDEVITVGNASFLSQADKTLIKRILNADFEINDDFSGNKSKLTFSSSAESTLVEEGARVVSNKVASTDNTVKIYLAKYKKNTCTWQNVIYYGVLEDYEDITMDEWVFLYANEDYCVYRAFAYSLPSSLPLNGSLPTVDKAPFIKYEVFRNVWLRKACQFKYEESLVAFTDSPGQDKWVLEKSTANECFFSYIKSTPYGCNFDIPSTSSIQITDDCACIEESSSSSSQSSSSSTVRMSSESSESSESTPSSQSSSLNSSSSDWRFSPKGIKTLYLRLEGEPFVGGQYILRLTDDDVPIVWKATSHASETKTTGTITLTLNSSGRFLLSADLKVDGSDVVIDDAVLSNIRGDNFAYYSSYLKGLSTICSNNITTKYTTSSGEEITNYDCIISYESLKRNNGSDKKLSEIIYDYELAELSVDDESEKVNLYFGEANTGQEDLDDICRAWGLFCLDYVSDGNWQYSNDEQEIKLNRTDGGCWTLYRKYRNSATDVQEIEMELDSKTVTANEEGEYDGFTGALIVPRYAISGGVEEAGPNDVCNDRDTVICFYSSDSCSQNSSYSPYYGYLALTIDGGEWNGQTSYLLAPNVISGNLAVWNWSSGSKVNDFEYAVLFSEDGVLWKLMLSKTTSSSRSYLFAEFIKENQSYDSFTPVFHKIHKSNICIDGEWGSGNATLTVSGAGFPEESSSESIVQTAQTTQEAQDDTAQEEDDQQQTEQPVDDGYEGGGYEEGYEMEDDQYEQQPTDTDEMMEP